MRCFFSFISNNIRIFRLKLINLFFMKKLYILLLTFSISAISFGQDLILTGIFDGPLTGGVPKVIELYVKNSITDLSIYGIESANNGAAAAGVEYTFPAEAKSAGTYIYLAYVGTNTTAFSDYFGFSATYLDNVANNNGDDAVILYKNGVINDVLGVVGEDGTGKFWDSVDGWIYRKSNTGPNTTFTQSEWTFSGIDATDGCTTNGSCASVFTIGTFTNTLSTKTTQIENFKMYPNPTALGYVNMSSKSNAKMDVSVFDVLGKQVLTQTVNDNRLNVSSLTSGIYLLKVVQEGATTTKKLVIN